VISSILGVKSTKKRSKIGQKDPQECQKSIEKAQKCQKRKTSQNGDRRVAKSSKIDKMGPKKA
jgi:hypothetical protein